MRTLGMAAFGVAALTAAAEYQFIVTSGWSAETASRAKASSLTSEPANLEARYRTWLESDGTDLDTTELRATTVILR